MTSNLIPTNTPRNITLFYKFKPMRDHFGSPESLTSYVRRLSREHHLKTKRLLQILGETLINGSNPEDWIGNPYDLGQLNGYLDRAKTLAEALEVATSTKHLKSNTFVPISNVIARNGIGGMSPYRKWCPLCLAEQKQRGLPFITLLAWTPKSVTACYRHLILLSDCCKNCGRKQKVISSIYDISKCPYCKSSLLKAENQKEIKESDCAIWIARQISTLVSRSDYELTFYSPKLIRVFLDKISRVQGIPVTEIGEITGLAGCTVHQWWRGRNRPSLEYLLWLLYATRIPINLFLDDPLSAANQACAFGIQRAPKSLTKKRRIEKRKWNHSEVRKKAKNIIANSNGKSVTRKIASELNIPQGTVRYICADLLSPNRRQK